MKPQPINLDLDAVLADWNTGTHDTIGELLPGAVEFAQACYNLAHEQGTILRIFTCRVSPHLYDGRINSAYVEAWLRKHGVPFDEVWTGVGKPDGWIIDDCAIPCRPCLEGEAGYEEALTEVRHLMAVPRLHVQGFPGTAICGLAGSGKTTAANWFLENTAAKGLHSTSEWYWINCLYEGLDVLARLKRNDEFRAAYAGMIDEKNREDAAALYRQMAADGYTLFDGIRRKRELAACRAAGIVQRVIWIERTDVECSDPTCEITANDCDWAIDNDGTPDGLDRELRKFCECFRIPILGPEAPPVQYDEA